MVMTIPTSNPFQPLSTDMDTAPQQLDEKKDKPPPIIVEQVTSYSNLCQLILKHVSNENFSTKTITNKNSNNIDIKISLTEPDDYRKLNRIFKDQNIRYHTYQLKADKAYRVVLRNLHPTTEIETIKEDLEAKNFKVRNIINARHPATKAPLPLFFVDLEPAPHNKEIFGIEIVAHTRIRVEEPRKRREIAQCFRCQAFGHTRSYCNRAPRCVKCGEAHLSNTCNVSPKSEHIKCVHCQGNHPASYRGCTVHRELEARIGRKVNPLRSYSAAAAPNPAAPTPASPKFNPGDFPSLQETTGQAQQLYFEPRPTPRPRSVNMPSYIPPPSSNDITSVLTSFLSDFKAMITPLITTLTTVMTQLLPILTRK
jgi:hypothetical protein